MQDYIKRVDYADIYVHYTRTINAYLTGTDYFFGIAEKQASFLDMNDMEPEKRMEALFRHAGGYFANMQHLVHDAALALVKLAVEDEQHDSKLSMDNLNESSKVASGVLGAYIDAAAKVNSYNISNDRFATAQFNHLALNRAATERCYNLMDKCGAYYTSKPATYRSSLDWAYRLQLKKLSSNIPV